MSHDIDDGSDNPYRPRTLKVRDPLHDAQLLRDLAIINAQTVKRLGPLPPGGLPVQPKRKPNLPQYTPASAADPTEDDPMKLHQLAATAIVPLAMAAAGCSHGIDAGSVTAQLNPHPQKRYEVTATTDAPGAWDSAMGRVALEVVNKECVPRDSFTGGQNVPNTTYDFELVRVGEKTWKGYFYRDQLQDENYFGLGICHWDAKTVGPIFNVRGEKFNAGAWLTDALSKGPQTTYFKKSDYGNQAIVKYGVQNYSSKDEDVIQHPDNYFQITVAIKEATP